MDVEVVMDVVGAFDNNSLGLMVSTAKTCVVEGMINTYNSYNTVVTEDRQAIPIIDKEGRGLITCPV